MSNLKWYVETVLKKFKQDNADGYHTRELMSLKC